MPTGLVLQAVDETAVRLAVRTISAEVDTEIAARIITSSN